MNNIERKTARLEGMAYANILFDDYFCAETAKIIIKLTFGWDGRDNFNS
jgi:hypothetical protein